MQEKPCDNLILEITKVKREWTTAMLVLLDSLIPNLLGNKNFEKWKLIFSVFHISKLFSSPSIRT